MWKLSTVDYTFVLLSAILSIAKWIILNFSLPFLVNLHRPQLPISQNPQLFSVSLPPYISSTFPYLQPSIPLPLLLLIYSSVSLHLSSCPSMSAPPFLQDFWQVWGVCRVACVNLIEKLHFVLLLFSPLISTFRLFCILCLFISFSLSITLLHSYC